METCRQRGTPEPPAQHPQGTDGRPSPSPSPGTCLRGRPRRRAGRSVGSPVRGRPPSPTPPGGPLCHVSNGSASRPGASAAMGGTRGAARCSLRFGAVTPREAGCTLHLRSFVRKLGGGHSFTGHREEEATNGPCLAPGRPEEPRTTWQPQAHPRANPAVGAGSGCRRQGGRGPRPRWKQIRGAEPGRGGGSRAEPGRGDSVQYEAHGGSGLDSGGAAGGPAGGLRSCCPGGDRSSGAGRPPLLPPTPRCSEERRAACDAESCRHLSHQTQHCALSPPPPL